MRLKKQQKRNTLTEFWTLAAALLQIGFWLLVIVLIFAATLLFEKWYYANIVFASF